MRCRRRRGHPAFSKETILRSTDKDLNLDPITGAPGAHPVGTGVGAAAGGATGRGRRLGGRGPSAPPSER